MTGAPTANALPHCNDESTHPRCGGEPKKPKPLPSSDRFQVRLVSLEVLDAEDIEYEFRMGNGWGIGAEQVRATDEVSITWRGQRVFRDDLPEIGPPHNRADLQHLELRSSTPVVLVIVELDPVSDDEIGRLTFTAAAADGVEKVVDFRSQGAHYRLTYSCHRTG